MKFRNSFLALSLAAVTFAPAALAQGNNDYAPSASPTSEPAPAAPPPSLENTQMQGRAEAGGPGGWQGGGGGRKRMKGMQGAGPGGAAGQGAGRAKIMAKFDANGDGTLDEAERAKLQEFRAQRKQSRLGKQGGLGNASFGEPGAGPSGVPSANFAGGPGAGGPGAGAFAGGPGGRGGANKQARMQKLIQRFDTDGDGALNAKEQAEADAFRAQRRQQRMMQQGGTVGLGGKPGKGLPTLPIAPDGGTGSAAGNSK